MITGGGGSWKNKSVTTWHQLRGCTWPCHIWCIQINVMSYHVSTLHTLHHQHAYLVLGLGGGLLSSIIGQDAHTIGNRANEHSWRLSLSLSPVTSTLLGQGNHHEQLVEVASNWWNTSCVFYTAAYLKTKQSKYTMSCILWCVFRWKNGSMYTSVSDCVYIACILNLISLEQKNRNYTHYCSGNKEVSSFQRQPASIPPPSQVF